jgi:hypothetical protein
MSSAYQRFLHLENNVHQQLVLHGIAALRIEFVGILAPVFVLPGRLFAGPHHAPTLEGQYVLKDIILVAGAWLSRPTRSVADGWSVAIYRPVSAGLTARCLSPIRNCASWLKG